MLCEKCKTREANVQLTQMVNGEVSTHHYCMKCAGMMNIVNSPMLDDFPLAKMLAGLLSMQESDDTDKAEYMDAECPTCHTKYSDIASDSKFGCPDCYDVFGPMINDTIKQLQGSDQHKNGNLEKAAQEEIREDVKADIVRDVTPSAAELEKSGKLMELRRKLKEALANEEYEEAAGYRDQIHELEAENAGSKADPAEKAAGTEKAAKAVKTKRAGKPAKSAAAGKPADTAKSSEKKKTAKTTDGKSAAKPKTEITEDTEIKPAKRKTAAKKTAEKSAEAEVAKSAAKKPAAPRRKKRSEETKEQDA